MHTSNTNVSNRNVFSSITNMETIWYETLFFKKFILTNFPCVSQQVMHLHASISETVWSTHDAQIFLPV